MTKSAAEPKKMQIFTEMRTDRQTDIQKKGKNNDLDRIYK